MQDFNLYALFRSRFPQDPQAVFLEHERGLLHYGEVDKYTGRVAGLLRELGLARGDRIIVQTAKSAESVLLYLGCLRAGVVYVPLNAAYTAEEVDYYLEDAEPALLVCDPAAYGAFLSLAERRRVRHVLTLDSHGHGTLVDRLAGVPGSSGPVGNEKDDPACILYTSGTTGRPRGAMLSHDNLGSNARVLHHYWGWRKGDVLLHILPLFHVHGLFVALHCALLNASRVIFLPKFDLSQVKQHLPRSTVMMGVPTHYGRLLEDPEFHRSLCDNIRLFTCGSAPLPEATFFAFEKRTGQRILERYGMTEAGMITSNPWDGERIAGSVGFALPGIEVRIRDRRGREAPAGEAGMLEVRGDNVFRGYWRLPGKTAEAFTEDGFFISGDLATMDADGRVAIVGRATDMVISGGYNVYPREIEMLMDQLASVRESAVIGLPHPDLGEAVTAVVVPREASLTGDAVLAALDGRLARFKRPKKLIFVDALPRNAMGKVEKQRLRETYRDLYRQ